MKKKVDVNVGDWIYSDSPGIWKIYRIIEGVQKFRYDMAHPKRLDRTQTVFSKRLVDGSWRPSFKTEYSDGGFIRELSSEDQMRLNEFIANNPQVMKEFNEYQPEQIGFALNYSLYVPQAFIEHIHKLVEDTFADIEILGLSNEDILQRIGKTELADWVSKGFSNMCLQFYCRDHEIRDNEYILREVKVF